MKCHATWTLSTSGSGSGRGANGGSSGLRGRGRTAWASEATRPPAASATSSVGAPPRPLRPPPSPPRLPSCQPLLLPLALPALPLKRSSEGPSGSTISGTAFSSCHSYLCRRRCHRRCRRRELADCHCRRCRRRLPLHCCQLVASPMEWQYHPARSTRPLQALAVAGWRRMCDA